MAALRRGRAPAVASPLPAPRAHLCLPLSRCEPAGGLGAAAGAGEELGALCEVLVRLGCGGATAGVGVAQLQGGTTWKVVERDEEEEKVLDANLP